MVSPSEMTVTSPPLRSRARSTMPAGATSGAPILRSVSPSRWSVWPCVESTTSTNASCSGATTRGCIRMCGVSVPSYFTVSESER